MWLNMPMKEDGKYLESLVRVRHEFGLSRRETDFLFNICAFELSRMRDFILVNGWDIDDPFVITEIKSIFDPPSLEELAVNILDARDYLNENDFNFRNLGC